MGLFVRFSIPFALVDCPLPFLLYFSVFIVECRRSSLVLALHALAVGYITTTQ